MQLAGPGRGLFRKRALHRQGERGGGAVHIQGQRMGGARAFSGEGQILQCIRLFGKREAVQVQLQLAVGQSKVVHGGVQCGIGEGQRIAHSNLAGSEGGRYIRRGEGALHTPDSLYGAGDAVEEYAGL